MADIPYLTKTSTITDFLTHLQGAGVPERVDKAYLDSVGFTSSADRPIIPLLRFIGFIDSSSRPTDRWKEFKARAKAPKVMGKALTEAYADLFKTYPDAPRKDIEALMDFFRSKTDLGDRAVSAIVNSFKALAAVAEFEGLEEIGEKEEPHHERKKEARHDASSGMPSLSITIQLQLPATENEAIYDKLFAALRKHLYTEPEREK
jgi:hypothetical protein